MPTTVNQHILATVACQKIVEINILYGFFNKCQIKTGTNLICKKWFDTW